MRLNLLCLALILPLLSSEAVAESNGDWHFVGPSKPAEQGEGMTIGRINAVAFDPHDPSTLYAGTPASGLWRTQDGGASWVLLTSDLSVLGVTDIAIDPQDAKILYVMTGDGEGAAGLNGPSIEFMTSIGVVKSVDGGQHWLPTGSIFKPGDYPYGHRLAIHPTTPKLLLAATEAGLYRTTDGGDHWEPVMPGVWYDVLFHPSDPSIVYAAAATTVYRSTDSGQTWKQLSGGLPDNPSSNRVRLAVTPASPDMLYVLFGARTGFTIGLYRSDDRGESFTKRSSTDPLPQDSGSPPINLTKPNILGYSPNDFASQSWYTLAMAVSPVNADRVHVGGVDTWRSDDGGSTWEMTSRWTNDPRKPHEKDEYTHADIHTLIYHDDALYAGTDGGLYRSTDGGDTWNGIANMSSGISSLQVYSVCGTPEDPTTLFFGAQDNGTWRLTLDEEGNEADAHQVLGGDGMVCQINPKDSSIVYASYYDGYLNRSDDYGQTFGLNIPPPPNQYGEAQWTVPYILAPDDAGTIYACFADVWRATEPDFKWTNVSAGALGASMECKQIAVAPSDPKIIYVAKDIDLAEERGHPGRGDIRPPFLGGGGVFRSKDRGATWQTITGTLPLAEAGLSNLAVSPTDAVRLWVTFTGHAAGNKVFGSTDGGETWINLSDGLPNLPVHAIAAQDSPAHGIYVGTTDGVYYRDDNLGAFKEFKHGLPSVVVKSLWIDQARHRLFAGTFARGVWQTSIPAPCLENCGSPELPDLPYPNAQ
jgi:photosystem II stability/assembly factor-like uncharacterized protein